MLSPFSKQSISAKQAFSQRNTSQAQEVFLGRDIPKQHENLQSGNTG